MRQTMLLAAGAALGMICSAEVFTVPSGETFEVDLGNAAATNVQQNVVDLGADATLKLVSSSGSEGTAAPLRMTVVATNGHATLDASALGLDALRLQNASLRAGSDGLMVAGVKSVVFGSESPSSHSISYPVFDVARATFTEPDATGFTLTNLVTLTRLPEDCACAISGGSEIAARGTDTLARFYVDGVLELTDWDLYLIENTVVPPEVPIRVRANHHVRYKPCTETATWEWMGAMNVAFTNRIELCDATARVRFNSIHPCSFYGSITGTGDVWQEATVDWTMPRIEVHAACSQTGTVHVAKRAILVFMNHDTPGAAENDVYLAEDGVFALHPEGYGTRPTTGYVHAVTGAYLAEGAELSAGSQETYVVGEVKGFLSLKGAADGTSTFIVDSVRESEGVWVQAGTKLTLRDAGDGNVPLRVAGEPNGTCRAGTIELMESGIHLQRVTADGGLEAVLSGTGVVDRVSGAGLLRVTPGSDIQVYAIDALSKVEPAAGAKVAIRPPQTDWRSKVALWLDATEASSMRSLADNQGVAQVYTNDYRIIDAWYDRRPEQRSLLALNNRMWSLGYYDLQPQVYPYLVTEGGPNGLPYMSFGTYQEKVPNVGAGGTTTTEARRLQFWRGEIKTTPKAAAEAYATVKVAWAAMVFGSQKGGGAAMLGANSNPFARAGTSLASPIAKSDFVLYVDGLAVSPTNTFFNGGWQLLSFDVGNRDVAALNWSSSYGNSGGQNYGEVILFSQKPTDAERQACEAYLATKWGLAPAVYRGVGVNATLRGAGEVTLAEGTEAAFDGTFFGTARLDGATLTVAQGRVPFTEAEIPSAGRVAWFDPNADGALGMSTVVERPLAVRVLHGRDNAGVVTTNGAYYLLGTYAKDFDRRPWLNEGLRGGRAAKWLDFTNKYGENKGNTLRLFKEPAPAGESSSTAALSVDVRTAFVAIDSTAGGGMPLIDKVGADDVIKARSPVSPASTPIWAAGTTDKIRNGATRLDGVAVDGTTKGYNARPEVLSLVATGTVPLSYFGWYGGDDVKTPNVETLGEILLYSTALEETARANIEAYLMKKWTGALPSGYVDLRAATVTGTGTVKAASVEALPSFVDFSGAFELSQRDFAFTLDAAATPAVANAVTLPGTATLPAACTVHVACATSPRPGSYALITSSGFTGATEWTLDATGDTGASTFKLRAADGTLYLDVAGAGTTFIVR